MGAYSMEHSNGWPSVVAEFWNTLAKLYGIPFFRDGGMDEARDTFWVV